MHHSMDDTITRTNQIGYVQHRRRSILVGYLITTATHGLHNIGVAYSTLHRTFWIATFVVMFGFMSYFILMELLQYLSFPTHITVEIIPQRDMRFPAVTICNANPYRKDRMNEALNNYTREKHINRTGLSYEELAFPMLVDMFNRNESDDLIILGFQLSDMLLECSYSGIDCSSNFVHSLSPVFGNCFTFNWKVANNTLFTLANLGSKFTLYEGLSMTFYVPTHLTFPISDFENGLVLFLHDNNELPFIAKNSVRLRPGLSHTITYRKSETIFLQKPYTNCTSAVGYNLRHIYEVIFDPKAARQVAYSEALCYELCEQAYIFSTCSCILPIPFLMRYVFSLDHNHLVIANSCIPYTSDEKCALNARQQIALNLSLMSTWCSRCVPQCKHTHYALDASALAAPTAQQKARWADILQSNKSNIPLPNDFASNYSAYMDANYLRVTVLCGSPYVTVHRQQAKLTFIDTFSGIGGHTGL